MTFSQPCGSFLVSKTFAKPCKFFAQIILRAYTHINTPWGSPWLPSPPHVSRHSLDKAEADRDNIIGRLAMALQYPALRGQSRMFHVKHLAFY